MRTHGLLVLRLRWRGASLSRSGEALGASVRFELHAPDGSRSKLGFVPAEELSVGGPRSTGGGPLVGLPDEVAAALRDGLAGVEGDPVLWLDLGRPAGRLVDVAWEPALRRAIGRPVPILRVPRSAGRSSWSSPPVIVLCASCPHAKAKFPIVDGVAAAVDAANRATGGRARVHVFTDAASLRGLQHLASESVSVHRPTGAEWSSLVDRGGRASARAATVEGGSTGPNPWLEWMRTALARSPVDVVHFLGHGYAGRYGGALALAESPLVNEDEHWSRFIGAPELARFLDAVGAGSFGWTACPSNWSVIGGRRLVHDVMTARPGLAWVHEPKPGGAWPEQLSALEELYWFHFADDPQVPDPSGGFAIHCPRSQLAGARWAEGVRPEFAAFVSPPRPRESGPTPSWVVRSGRWIERAATSLETGEVGLRPVEIEARTEALTFLAELHRKHEMAPIAPPSVQPMRVELSSGSILDLGAERVVGPAGVEHELTPHEGLALGRIVGHGGRVFKADHDRVFRSGPEGWESSEVLDGLAAKLGADFVWPEDGGVRLSVAGLDVTRWRGGEG